MKLRAIRSIETFELIGFGADNDQAGQMFGDNQVWSKLVIEPDQIPSLSEEALERLKDYCMEKYPINPFIVNYDETTIEQLPNETLFASITPEIVAAHMEKFEYKQDLEFANKYEKSIVEVFPERYYEDTEEGVVRRKVDNLIADPELRYLDDKPMIDEKIEEDETIEENINEEVVEETTEESSDEVVE